VTFDSAFPTRANTATMEFAVIGTIALNLVFVLWLSTSLLAAPSVREREIPMDLAAVADGASFVRFSPREVIVRIDASGTVRAGGSVAKVEVLEELLRRLAEETAGTSVSIRADARAPYGIVARVLAATRKAGIRDVSLLVVDASSSPSGS
jgi:biopolymer transport protein ExbD